MQVEILEKSIKQSPTPKMGKEIFEIENRKNECPGA